MRRTSLAAIALLLLATTAAFCAPVLRGETNKPKINTFVLNEPVTLTFSMEGLAPGQTDSVAVTVATVDGVILTRSELPVLADANGKWSSTIPAPSARLGYCHVTAKAKTGLELPAVESRPAGYLTYMVVIDPKERVQPGENAHFGMQGGFTTAFDARPLLGVHWVLGGYTWRDYEPDRAGQFAETRAKNLADPKYKQAIEENHKLGILPLPCLYFSPKWAVDANTLQYCTGTLTQPEAWAEYCHQIGKAFPEDYPWLQKHVYQITWEPVYPWGYKGTDEDLIRIHEIAFKALHEVDPKAVVVGPTGAGINAGDVAWNERLLKKGIGRYVDAYAIHPYVGQPPEKNNLVENCRALKEIIRTYAGHDMDVYGTEQGWPTGQDQAKEILQAQWLTRSYLIMLGEGFKANFAFYATDYPGEPGYGFFHNLNMTKIPWGTDSVSPKPEAAAYAAMTMVLEGHKSAGAVEWLGPTTLGYAYERTSPPGPLSTSGEGGNGKPGAVTLALWDYGDNSRSVQVPVGVEQVEIIDWMGNATMLKAPKGILPLTLTGSPVYVRGVSPALWGSGAKRPLTLSPASVSAFPGDKVTLQAKAFGAAGNSLEGELKIELPDQLETAAQTQQISVAKGAEKTLPLSFDIPIDAPPGAYSVKAMVQREGALVGFGTALVRVKEPFAVESVLPARPGGKPGLVVTVRNMRPQPVAGSLRVRLKGVPDSFRESPLAIAASASATVNVEFGQARLEPTRVYQALITAADRSGAVVTSTRRATFALAAHVATPLQIGSDLGAWPGAAMIPLQGREFILRQPQFYRGPQDLSAKLWYAWDEKMLYFAAEVTDDVFLQEKTGFDTWSEDCIQLAFDPDPGRVIESSGNLLADVGNRKRNSEIDIALTKSGPEAYRSLTFDEKKLPVALIPAARLKLAVVRKGDKMLYQAAIPWDELGMTPPKAGSVLGIAVAVNDRDDAVKETDPKALCLFGGISPTKNPALFGTLLLGK